MFKRSNGFRIPKKYRNTCALERKSPKDKLDAIVSLLHNISDCTVLPKEEHDYNELIRVNDCLFDSLLDFSLRLSDVNESLLHYHNNSTDRNELRSKINSVMGDASILSKTFNIYSNIVIEFGKSASCNIYFNEFPRRR